MLNFKHLNGAIFLTTCHHTEDGEPTVWSQTYITCFDLCDTHTAIAA